MRILEAWNSLSEAFNQMQLMLRLHTQSMFVLQFSDQPDALFVIRNKHIIFRETITFSAPRPPQTESLDKCSMYSEIQTGRKSNLNITELQFHLMMVAKGIGSSYLI